jgi:hypothetical protein
LGESGASNRLVGDQGVPREEDVSSAEDATFFLEPFLAVEALVYLTDEIGNKLDASDPTTQALLAHLRDDFSPF